LAKKNKFAEGCGFVAEISVTVTLALLHGLRSFASPRMTKFIFNELRILQVATRFALGRKSQAKA
jgi:hypothetical protein